MKETKPDKQKLIRILQHAYSGEKAAALAYQGHGKSVKDSQEKKDLKKIEDEEWEHRDNVLNMLKALGAKPKKIRDRWMGVLGRLISFGCYLSGWFFPMYFAGRIESKNTIEYENALFHMSDLEFPHFQIQLKQMARVEKDHEKYFFEKVQGHWLLPWVSKVFKWGKKLN